MSEFDPLLLARLQFAANISFHILFPTISIGLCWVLLYFRTRFTVTAASLLALPLIVGYTIFVYRNFSRKVPTHSSYE